MATIDYDNILRAFKKECEKVVTKYEDIIIEKIAFSLFCMCHYKHRLYDEQNFILRSTLKELSQTWKLGKIKGETGYFILLAKNIFKINLDNDKEVKNENKKL